MRSVHLFNDGWLFTPAEVGPATPDADFNAVTLPHSNVTLPHHNFDEAAYKFVSTYRKRFNLPEPLRGRRVYLDFDASMIATTVTLNGHTFDEHRGGYTPFSLDITDYLVDGENVLNVRVDSTERQDIPPYGYVIDYLLFGGLYRDVHLRYVNPVHITDLFIKPREVLSAGPWLEVDVTLLNQSASAFEGQLSGTVQHPSVAVAVCRFSVAGVKLEADETQTIQVQLNAEALRQWVNSATGAALNEVPYQLWTLAEPALYHLNVTLSDGTHAKNALDAYGDRFGFREAVFREDGFYFNGERLQLRGLNRHQNYPYIGPAAPQRLQERDADILKDELGCNIARTSHYPQSPHFIRRCDEIGLLVFEEIPGWQHIGDQAWQELSLRDVRAMIERDRNYPCIILWGVRINESLDDTAFYTATNRLAHELDPTRQTGGVRFWQYSEFLEDVYTFNDFSNGIEEPVQTPHLVCEFNGHMYPTKTFDNEERLMEHARRHAYIQAQAASVGGVSGAIGWCAFDYNTHQEFGSGDRICYHGVMDIFRLPKWAAYVYGSQIDPAQRLVLQAATSYTMGDRAEGGNDPILVFSNCDSIEVFVGDNLHGHYEPDADHYPHLPHPPFTVPMQMAWGQRFQDLHIVGYLKGERVIEQHFPLNPQPTTLELRADDLTLKADGADMTRLSVRILDQHGNPLRYAVSVVSFELEGPGELIGTNPFPLVGGQAALYLKATHVSGLVTVQAKTPRLEAASVMVEMLSR